MTENKNKYIIISAIAVTVIIFSIIGINMSSSTYYTSSIGATASEEPNHETFWINTVHLDGNTALHAAGMHPAEAFPTKPLPSGGGLVLVKPDSTGAWMIRSFTFVPAQIVVHQGDFVTLNFVGVQGFHHEIEVEGIENFTLNRGEMHTVTFTADKIGTIDYYCHVHMPNMEGQIVVLPKA